MMDETLAYLEGRKNSDPSFTYEVIVVDDGSTDNTSRVSLTSWFGFWGPGSMKLFALVNQVPRSLTKTFIETHCKSKNICVEIHRKTHFFVVK
jgi:cellulose synthase/poly-beta-1,6-N-acetylglucosamine synthase-like glycosyltransferase